MSNPDYFISAGITGGNPGGQKLWGTYTRKPHGSLKRVVSKHLPLRETEREAENDLLIWLGRKVSGRCPAESKPYVESYHALADKRRAEWESVQGDQ